MDRDHCLILTNLEYAEDSSIDPLEKRTFARNSSGLPCFTFTTHRERIPWPCSAHAARLC